MIGSKLWINKTLFTDAYSKSQDSDKLSAKRYGPFVVTEIIGRNAVRLDLPSHFRIHPVVHVIHTTPYVEQPRDIAHPVPSRPEPVPTVQGEEHVVDQPTVPLMSADRAGRVLIKLSAGARATITRRDRHCQPPSRHLQKLVHSELHLVIALANIRKNNRFATLLQVSYL